jgi:hypothetical protein
MINDSQVDTLTGRNGDDWFFHDGVCDIVVDLKTGDEELQFIPAP